MVAKGQKLHEQGTFEWTEGTIKTDQQDQKRHTSTLGKQHKEAAGVHVNVLFVSN